MKKKLKLKVLQTLYVQLNINPEPGLEMTFLFTSPYLNRLYVNNGQKPNNKIARDYINNK